MNGLSGMVPGDEKGKSMATIQALVIEPGGEVRREQIDRGLSALQSLVGGYIEAAPLDTDDVTVWINEEGKLIGLEPNPVGTVVWYALAPFMRGRDVLCGTVVITGGADDEGDTMGLTDEWAKSIETGIEQAAVL